MHRRVLPLPLLYLNAFFEATRRDYYENLRGVTESGDWEEWLVYFLNGVSRQSEDALDRAERLNHLLDLRRGQLDQRGMSVARRMLNLLAVNPFLTVTKAAKQLDVAYNTAAAALRKLSAQQVVKQVGDARRDRVYCATALLDILEEPSRITPL